MAILFLSIACIANSFSIIFICLSLRRCRSLSSFSVKDLEHAKKVQDFVDRLNKSSVSFKESVESNFGSN